MQIGTSDPTSLERARREFDLLASTPHPNLVRVESDLLAIGEPVEGVAWLEEYLDGVDVTALLGSPWAHDDVLRLGIDVSGALGALHSLGVVHRDLSSGNVRQLTNGHFKVMDPGFAKHTFRTGITVGGQPGTRGFMTPEHVQPYTSPIPPSDVFALGNLMYAAATGALPFPYLGDDGEYVARLLEGRFTPIGALRHALTDSLADTIERALHPHPARRFRSGQRFHSHLLEIS
jgi:serine/threonine protein kinase